MKSNRLHTGVRPRRFLLLRHLFGDAPAVSLIRGSGAELAQVEIPAIEAHAGLTCGLVERQRGDAETLTGHAGTSQNRAKG
jgi:hypothetical protein